MASVIEGMLQRHAEAETHLAYLALDHALAHQGELERMHQDHHEIDARLRSVQSADSVAEARRLLDAALLASREHFQGEERTIFPLLEKVLQHDTLSALGNTWLQRNIEVPGRFFPATLAAGSG
jgi:hemerythrin-like domain-containing protein